ncbi:MAG TPA: hypothetical protein PLL10_04380 [Elusimicrobiales bacterium]|nr:hypothetical protein [Elusimicrobiales bacterium]
MKTFSALSVLAALIFAIPSSVGAAVLPSGLPERQEQPQQPNMAVSAAVADNYPDLPPNNKPLGLGISHAGDPYDIPGFSPEMITKVLQDHGGSYYRAHIPIKEAMPVISPNTYRRLLEAADNPQELDSLIDELAKTGKWERMDSLVDTFVSKGINLVLVVGCGYQMEAPLLAQTDGKQQKVSPKRLGRKTYLTMVKMYVGAAVRRYAAKVQVWQVENEINTMFAHAVAGWRIKDTGWINKSYGIEMLKELSEIVHKEGARQGLALKTTQNFATAWIGWEKYIRDSAQYLDIIGIDLYANYFVGWPPADKQMADCVLKAKAAGGGKPVWVLEAGFADAPAIKGFSPQAQAAYFKRLIDRCFRNGAEVVMLFGWFYNPGGWQTNGTGKPAPWYSIYASEAHWNPTHVDPQTGEIICGPAWDEFKKSAQKWFPK